MRPSRLPVLGPVFGIASLSLALAAAAPARAEAPPPEVLGPKVEIAKAMLQGQPGKACHMLEQGYDLNATTDTDILYMRGQCLQALGRDAEAIAPYEQILSLNPRANAVRLPLARAYRLSGQSGRARENLREVLAANPDGAIADNVRNALQAMQAQKPWFFRAEGGVVYDSNISAGPDTAEITVLGLPFTLGTASREQDSFGYNAELSGAYRFALNDRSALVAQASYSHTDYFENSLFDSQIVSAAFGPAYSFGPWQFNANIAANWRALDRDTYSRGIGANGRAAYRFTPRTSASVSAGIMDQNYQSDARDGVTSYALGTVAHQVTDRIVLEGGYAVSKETAEDDRFENTKHGPTVGAAVRMTDEWQGRFNLSYSDADYDGADPFFNNQARRDELYSASATLSYDLGARMNVEGLALNLRGSYTRADSNLEIYDYDRQTVTLSVSKTW